MEIALKSRTQTVRVKPPDQTTWSLEVAQAPVSPLPVPTGYALLWQQANGTLTYFFETGDVERFEPSGIRKVWMERPTLPYVLSLPPHSSLYVEFLVDGSVETRWEGERVFWGPEEPALDVAPVSELRRIKWPIDDREWSDTLQTLLEESWQSPIAAN